MKKEQLKSFILTVLILIAVFLTTQIWFDKKLWPNGYNFFNSIEKMPVVGQIIDKFSTNKALNTASSFEDIMLPYRMIVSGANNARSVYLQDSSEYTVIKEKAFDVLDHLYATDIPKYTVISGGEWFQSLKGNSILMDYGTTMNLKLMLQIRKKPDSAISTLIEGFSEIIITPNDTESGGVYVYMRDNKSESYYRFSIAYDKQEVRNIIETYIGQKQQKYAFAFELNLQKTDKSIDVPVDRMYLDPLVLLPLDRVEKKPVLHMGNPFLKDVNTTVYEQVVQAFDLQPNNLRRSVNSNGTVSYIENKATVDISPNGRIDYKAVDENSGMLAETLYDKVNLVWEIASKQYNITVPNQPFVARINSDLSATNQENVSITMNYLYGGIPIIVDPASAGNDSCITAEFSENRLIKFSMLVRSIQKLEENSDAPFVLEALDKIYPIAHKNEQIDKVFTCYVVNEQEQTHNSSITWSVMQSNNIIIAK